MSLETSTLNARLLSRTGRCGLPRRCSEADALRHQSRLALSSARVHADAQSLGRPDECAEEE